MPANSADVVNVFITNSPSIVISAIRTPNSSRMRAERPLPETTPMRAAISCTTMSATVMGTSVQRSL